MTERRAGFGHGPKLALGTPANALMARGAGVSLLVRDRTESEVNRVWEAALEGIGPGALLPFTHRQRCSRTQQFGDPTAPPNLAERAPESPALSSGGAFFYGVRTAMPDPEDCRAYAESCRRIATERLSVWDRHTLIYIADRWDQFALEIEGGAKKPNSNVTSLQEWSNLRSRR